MFEFVEVPGRDRFGVGEFCCEHEWYTNFVGVYEGVGRNNGARCKVDTFAHHVLAKQTLLLLQYLSVK